MRSTPVDTVWQVDFRSIGPIRINMTVPEAAAILGEQLEVPPPEESACKWSEITSSKTPPGVRITVYRDTIVRIDVDSAGVQTVDGLRVGSTVDEIVQKYNTSIKREVSLDGEPVFTVASPEPAHAFLIVYRTDGARVVSITSGRRSAAQIQECA